MLQITETIVLVSLLVSAILSLNSFKWGWPLPLRIFSGLLWVMIITEITASLWKVLLYEVAGTGYTKYNEWLYNVSFFIQYPLYFLFFYQVFHSSKYKQVVSGFFFIFIMFAFINFFLLQGKIEMNTNTMIFADLATVLFSLKYFSNLKEQVEITHPFKDAMTWIMLGIFINHSVNIPYTLALKSLWQKNPNLALAFFYVYSVINIAMNIFFAKAYLCKTPLRK